MGLAHHREDFGQTFAVWGIGSGPYLMIPFAGSSNVRDAIGMVVGLGAMPQTYIDLPPRAGLTAMWVIRQRSGNPALRRRDHGRSVCVPARGLAEAPGGGDCGDGGGGDTGALRGLQSNAWRGLPPNLHSLRQQVHQPLALAGGESAEGEQELVFLLA